jgi:hypothetical protein
MNPLSLRFRLLATVLFFATASLTGMSADATTKAAQSFERTRRRIDVLLKHRLNPEPLPAIMPNPFFVVEEAPPAGAAAAPDAAPDPAAKPVPAPDFIQPGSDEEALARYVPMFRITGKVLLNGQEQLIINSAPYKEGDLIPIPNTHPALYIRLIRIAPGEATFGLNNAVQVLKFKT